jgi:hypothetical protein
MARARGLPEKVRAGTMSKIGPVAFVTAILLAGESFAANKIMLACEGTLTKNGEANEHDSGESIVIDLEEGIVQWRSHDFPITGAEGNFITFGNELEDETKKEHGKWTAGTIDHVLGKASITEDEFRNYGTSDTKQDYDLTCKK